MPLTPGRGCEARAPSIVGGPAAPAQAGPLDDPSGLEQEIRERIERELEAARARLAATSEPGDGLNVVQPTNVVVVITTGGSSEASARQTVRIRQDGTSSP